MHGEVSNRKVGEELDQVGAAFGENRQRQHVKDGITCTKTKGQEREEWRM